MPVSVGELLAYLRLDSSQFDRGIAEAQGGMRATAGTADKMTGAVDSTSAALTGAGRSAAAASTGTARFRAAQLSAIAAAERYNTLLNEEGVSVGRLASAEASVIRANERVAVSAAQAGAAMKASAGESYAFATATNRSLGASLVSVGKLGLGLAGLVGAFKAVELVHQANEFQQKMLLLQTNAGASADEVKKLSAAVLQLSPQVATGPNDLADALYHIEQNSHGLLSTTQMMQALKIGAEGAKIGMADVEDTTNTLTIAMASGVKGVDNFRRTMGFMIATAGTGDMRLSQLNEAVSTGILGIAKGFMPANDVLRDTAAIFATLGDNGIRGATAMQAYRQTLMGFALPAKQGAAALQSVGLSMTDLADAMSKHGIVFAMNDLNRHMQSVGITGSKVGGFLTQAFGRKAGSGITVLMGEIDRLNLKFQEGLKGAATMSQKWDATTKTTAFALQRLGAQAQVLGIELAQHAAPAVAGLAGMLTTALPAALHVAQAALAPFVIAWHGVQDVLGPVFHTLGSAGSMLAPLAPVLKGVAAAVLSMWFAFKGYELARAAVFAVQDAAAGMSAGVRNSLMTVRSEFGATSAQLATQSAVMDAEFAQIAAAAQESAATQAEAQLAAMRTYQEVSAAEIAAMEATAVAARESAVATAAAAEEASATVATAGETARFGWASLAGPLGLAAIGVMTIVSMFHKSTQASQEATDAAKAYTDALTGDSAGRSTMIGTIVDQLSKNDVPGKINALSASLHSFGGFSGLPATQIKQLNDELVKIPISGKQFVTAIMEGGKPLDDLRGRLQSIIDKSENLGKAFGAGFRAPAGSAGAYLQSQADTATALLADLNAQSLAITTAQRKTIAAYKDLGMVASPVTQVAQKLHLTSDEVKRYAGMLGLAVDKSGLLVDATAANKRSILDLSDVYNNASQSVSGLLAAWQTFSQSDATSADRAALIGATLRAANGDALAFTASLAGTTSAINSLVDSFAQERQTLAQQSQSQASAAERVSVAQKHLDEVRANSKSTAYSLASAEKSLHDAQAAAAQQGALAYADTERAALRFKQTQNGLHASIDTTAKGAPALIQGLQGIQDAAMAAASAEYQHYKAQEGGKKAAEDAYNIYVQKTRGALIDNAKQFGLTNQQARALAKTYFGFKNAGNIKKTIEAEGADKLDNVLQRLVRVLGRLAGQDWNIRVKYHASGHLPSAVNLVTGAASGPGFASGGLVNGPGMRGVDSVRSMLAPGEEVVKTAAVDRINRLYGAGVWPLINAGRLPTAAGGMSNGGQQKAVHIEHFTYAPVINYPEKDKDTEAVPRTQRGAFEQIQSFL